MLRVALVGAGGMGRAHASFLSNMDNAQLVAVCDTRRHAAEEVAASCGARAFSDTEEMMRSIDCDVIDVCLPTCQHHPHIKLAAAAGKHVCCEKPFGRTLEDCHGSISACRDAGVELFIAHVLRWFPEYKRAREIIQSGAIGSPAVVRTSRGCGLRLSKDSWFSDSGLSGGVILDLLVHDFDWLLWTFGPVERVFAKGVSGSGVRERDYALVTLRFKSGVIGHVEGNWASPGSFQTSFEVAGDAGLLEHSSVKARALEITRWTDGGSEPVYMPVGEASESPYYQELKHFLDCVESGTKLQVTPEDAMAAVEVALAATESIETGRPVEMGR